MTLYVHKQDLNTPIEDLDLSPATWQHVLDSFYGKPDEVESPGGIVLPEKITDYSEKRPGLVSESIDKDAYREFMRNL